MGWCIFSGRAFATAFLTLGLAFGAAAETVEISEEPAVSVDVPSSFETKKLERGIQAKTPDGEVFVWFETYAPDEFDSLVKEHNDYWVSQGAVPGDDKAKFEKSAGGKSVVATDFKGATWKDKPTVIRYLEIDAGLPSHKRVLMSLWASPEADKAHDAEVMEMIGSLKIKE